MKKFLFIITCFCSILTISCASKKAQETTEIFESPAIDLEQDDTAQTDSENQNENKQEENFNNLEHSDTSTNDFETQDSPQMEIIGKEEIILETEQEAQVWFTEPSQKDIDSLSKSNDKMINEITGAAP